MGVETLEHLNETTKELVIFYLMQFDNIDEVVRRVGISKDEIIAWVREGDFYRRLYASERACAKTIIRSPNLPEPVLQWLENTQIEVLPLLYNFDGIDDDEELKAFTDKYNIYTGNWIYTISEKHTRGEIFRQQLKELRQLIDKYLAGEELLKLEKVKIRYAHGDRNAPVYVGESDGGSIIKNLREYKNAFNAGSISIQRAYADMWEVIRGQKQLKRCAAPDCNKIFVPRKAGGRKQQYHSTICAARIRQREFKKKKLAKINA